MKSCYEPVKDIGRIIIKLNLLIQQKNINRHELTKAVGEEYAVIDKLCKGSVVKIDLTVLSKICYALECGIEDILEYESAPRTIL